MCLIKLFELQHFFVVVLFAYMQTKSSVHISMINDEKLRRLLTAFLIWFSSVINFNIKNKTF